MPTGPLPAAGSYDPTQWVFAGRPEQSNAALQVAIARLLGYRWPEQGETDELDLLADADGIDRKIIMSTPKFKEALEARGVEVAMAHPRGPVYLVLPREPLAAPLPELSRI